MAVVLTDTLRELGHSLLIGETRYTRHSPCPASGFKQDTKPRLSVTRARRNLLLFKCHHCGQGGSVRLPCGVAHNGVKRVPERINGAFPTDMEHHFGHLPKEAVEWLAAGGIDERLFTKHRLGWSPGKGRLILPCVSLTGKLLGYQMRGFKEPPKYLTRKFGNSLYSAYPGRGSTVFCEDIVSAIRVADAGYNSYALLGVSMGDKSLLEVLGNGVTSAVVWLDNDNPTVRRCARKLVHTLQGYGVECNRVIGEKDPKGLSKQEIIAILKCI